MKIPRKILMKKLTEFVTECKNEEALNSFFSEVLNIEIAKWNDEQISVTNEGKTVQYTPRELVSYMLDQVDHQSIIREQVSRVKENYNYKQAE